MKRLIKITMVSLIIFAIGCEKENIDAKNIKITTSKNAYVVSSKIDVTIKNDLNKQAAYFICDNVDLRPTQIMKNENGKWIEIEYPFKYLICTQMGPMGFFGVIDIAETKHDTLSLFNEIGKFKLRYRFVVDNDTFYFDSNEFFSYGSEQ